MMTIGIGVVVAMGVAYVIHKSDRRAAQRWIDEARLRRDAIAALAPAEREARAMEAGLQRYFGIQRRKSGELAA